MRPSLRTESSVYAIDYVNTMERLLKVVQELSASHDLKTVMDIVRHSIRDLLNSDGATFVLRENDSCYYVEEDAISPLWKGKKFPMETCISGWVMIHGEPAVIKDIYQDSRIPIDVYRKTFVESLAMVPIKTSSPIGAIGCYWAHKHEASPEQVKILRVLADTAAIAMDNIRYQGIIAEKAEQLEQAMEGTMLVIAKMVEQKDLYTSGHQRRVAAIAYDIAHALQWEQDTCDTLFKAGIVHDIGKVGIPSEILSKPAKLTSIEYDLVKMHPQHGYEMLKHIPLLQRVADIIHQHHERLDGSGYPAGLKTDAILAEAQVLAVADVFESMTAHRPYRPSLGLEAAVKELEGNKGVLYRQEAVDALVTLVRRDNYQVPELA